MKDTDNAPPESKSWVEYLSDLVLTPFRVLTSPTLLRTYLQTFLLLFTSFLLFGVAVLAYTSLYYAYIPIRGIQVPVYLQYDYGASTFSEGLKEPLSGGFGSGSAAARNALALSSSGAKHPSGVAAVTGLVSRQKYDISVEMMVPRSERNLEAGVWMLDLEMRGPGAVGGGAAADARAGGVTSDEADEDEYLSGSIVDKLVEKMGDAVGKPRVLARSRRPAILTYRSWIAELAHRLLRLPFYAVGWGRESETLVVKVMEDVEFEKGWRNVPSSLRLQLRSHTPPQVYSVTVRFAAKLAGLRWLMYQYRLASFLVGVGVFWGVEMGMLLFSWAVLSLCFGGSPRTEDDHAQEDSKTGKERVKAEIDELGASEPQTPLSDTSRTFPTLPSHQSLQYTSPKEEETSKLSPRLEDIPVKGEADADDEEDEDDESADFVLEEPLPVGALGALTDSGIGTSMESGADRGAGTLNRRRSGSSGAKKRW